MQQWVRHLNALPESKIKAICQDYKSGMDMSDVAIKNNVCYKVVWKYLHLRGIPIRGRRVYSQEVLDEIEEDYKSGMKVKDIADKYNLTYDAMHGIVKTYFEPNANDGRGYYKRVIKMDLDGNELKEYPSMQSAGDDNHVGVKYIRACCRGQKEQLKGFKYKWGRSINSPE